MKNPFRKIELQLESLFEGSTSVLSRRTAVSARILSEILQALETHLSPGERAAWIAPNRFLVTIGVSAWASLSSPEEIQTALERKILDHVRQNDLVCVGPVSVVLQSDSDLRPHAIRVWAETVRATGEDTDRQTAVAPTPADFPAGAFFIINGRTHFPLNRPVINIGRHLENHLVLDDPLVSRKHVQLRLREGRFLLTDLNSKHGTRINNLPISDCLLAVGDVVRLGNTELIYADEADDTRTQPFEKPADAGSSTPASKQDRAVDPS